MWYNEQGDESESDSDIKRKKKRSKIEIFNMEKFALIDHWSRKNR